MAPESNYVEGDEADDMRALLNETCTLNHTGMNAQLLLPGYPSPCNGWPRADCPKMARKARKRKPRRKR